MAFHLGNTGGGSGRRRRGARRAPMADINVTPLVDVMLVLLIIFMVTAPLLTAAVPLDLPDSRANALPDQPDQVTLSMDASGALFIDQAPVAPDALPDALARLAARQPQPQVTFRADRTIDYGRIMGVMGELNHAGIGKIALVTNGGAAQPALTGRSASEQ